MFPFLRALLHPTNDAKDSQESRLDQRLVSHCVVPFTRRKSAVPAAAPPARPARRTMIRSAEAEKRAWVRYECDLPVACEPDVGGGGMHWLGHIRNISRGGVELITERRFERGTILNIHGEKPNSDDRYTLISRVLRVRASGDGKWLLACRLGRDLGEEELQELLQASEKPAIRVLG